MDFFRSSILTFGSKIIFFAISLAVGVLIARALGPEGRGQYALYITVTLLGMVISKSGVEVAGMYYISKKEGDIKEIAGTCLGTGLFFSLIISILLYSYFRITKQALFPGFQQFGIYASMVAIPCLLFRIYSRLLLMGVRRIIAFNCLNWFSQIFMLIGASIVLYIGATVDKMIFVHIIALLLNSAIAAILLKQSDMLTIKFKWEVFKKLIKYGFPTAIGNTCKNLVLKVDILILGYYVSDASIGFYSIAVGLSEKLFHLPDSLQTLITHWVASEGDKKIFMVRVYRNLFYILLLGSIGLMMFSGPLIRLLYPGFEPAISVTYILIPATFMFSLYVIVNGYILGSAHTKQHMVFSVLALTSNIIFNLLLIPQFDIIGAAIATLISYSLLHISSLRHFVSVENVDILSLFIPSRDDLVFYNKLMRRENGESIASSLRVHEDNIVSD